MLKEKQVYRFGRYRLEPEERALFRDGEPVQLTGKAFDLLVLLVARHGSLVRKDQIITRIWPDTHVSDNNLDVALSTVRKAFKKERYIENVPGHGYRFTAEVTEGPEGEPVQVHPKAKKKYLRWITGALLAALAATLLLAFHARSRMASAEQRPGTPLYMRALEYERSGDDEEALATLDQALSVDPTYDEACVRAAYLAYELEDMPKSAGYLKKCMRIAPEGSAVALKAQGLNELLSDNASHSIELYQLLVDRYPLDVDALYRFAEIATDIDRIEEADKAVSACLRIEPNNPFCRFQLMYVRLKENRFDDVISDYKSLPSALREYPWFDEPLGVAYLGRGKVTEATGACERLIRSQARFHGTTHFTTGKEWLADVMLYEGHVKDATRRIQQLMETSDNASSGASYLVYLGRIYALLGDKKEATKFAYAAAAAPGDASDLTSAAAVLASVGETEGAERVLKIRNSKTPAPLSPANEHLIRGMEDVAKGDMSGGIAEIRLAHDLHAWDEETTYWLGLAYLKSGDNQAALDTFEQLRGLKGTILLDDVPFMITLASYRIAECYEKLGDVNSAKTLYGEVAMTWATADEDMFRELGRGHHIN